MNSGIRVLNVEVFQVRAAGRTPLSFGSVVVQDLPIGYARATVENRAGQVATGWGAMFLMHLWSWPVARASAEARGKVICELFDTYAGIVCESGEFAHPVQLFVESVGLAARTHTIKGVEANSRQFYPEVNETVAGPHPGLFHIRDGYARTSSLTGGGLGMDIDKVPGFAEAIEQEDRAYRAAESKRPGDRR